MRRCHPRDLSSGFVGQVKALAAYHGERPELRLDYLDKACSNYFGSSTVAISQRKPAAVQQAAGPMTAASVRFHGPSIDRALATPFRPLLLHPQCRRPSRSTR